MSMHHTLELAGLLLGLLFGSFLNVCIARVPRGESVVSPRSRCPACDRAIRWFDTFPVASWLRLRGRCRDCQARISWQYPAVEVATGLWFAVAGSDLWAAWHPGPEKFASYPAIQTIGAVSFAVLGFLLIGLLVIDWQTLRLPDAFTLSGIATGFFLVCTQAIFLEGREGEITFVSKHLRLSSPGSFAAKGNVFLTGTEALIYGRLAAIAAAALILILVRILYKTLRKREGLGLGDVKLLAMIAAFLGFWPAVLTLFVGVLLATVYAIFLLATRRANSLTRLPLGSFLAAGGLFAALFGDRILAWYRTLLV